METLGKRTVEAELLEARALLGEVQLQLEHLASETTPTRLLVFPTCRVSAPHTTHHTRYITMMRTMHDT